MSEQQIAIATPNAVAKPVTLANLLSGDKVKQRFNEILGKKAPGFISSVLSVANNNALLKKAKPQSVLNAAVIAATLDLPINQNLGFAYIVPYKDEAQFLLGFKGLVQLAMRSGQYKTINVNEVYEGEIKVVNRFIGEYEFPERTSDKIVGYMAYFKLVNGFEKYLYMSKEDCEKHGKKYSQTFKRGGGLWSTDFDAMAKKTVLKMLLSKFGILSIEMQRAQVFDQAVVRNDLTEVEDIDSAEIAYVDNETTKSRLKDLASANVMDVEVVDETTGEVMSEEQPMSDELPFD
jgi:recombination protein RecT